MLPDFSMRKVRLAIEVRMIQSGHTHAVQRRQSCKDNVVNNALS
jgi:hypothetical protein